MATASSPLAIYAAQDQARASVVIQGLGNITSVAVPSASLGQALSSLGNLQAQIDASSPIVLLVSSITASSALFQSIALYCQSQSKRVIVIDLDDAGTANVTGNIKNFSDTVNWRTSLSLPIGGRFLQASRTRKPGSSINPNVDH